MNFDGDFKKGCKEKVLALVRSMNVKKECYNFFIPRI